MSGPNTIMFIRHAEKPGEHGPPHGINHDGEHDPHSLSVRGWTRAGALAGLFARGPSLLHPTIVAPERIIATRSTHEYMSKREVDTVTPLAHRLGINIDDSFGHSHADVMVSSILNSSQTTLVAWHHGSMPDVVSRFPVSNDAEIPQHWPDSRFDLIWILLRKPGGDAFQFMSVNQGLLQGDLMTG